MRAVRLMRFTLAPAIAAGWILSGCGNKDNPVKPPNNPPGSAYIIRSTPQNALINLELAYSHRDSTECKELYDSSYVGTSEDYYDPPGTVPLSFTWSDEVGHVATLARVPTISSVTLSFGPSASWNRLWIMRAKCFWPKRPTMKTRARSCVIWGRWRTFRSRSNSFRPL